MREGVIYFKIVMVIVLDIYLAIVLVFDTHCNMTNFVVLFILMNNFARAVKLFTQKLHVYFRLLEGNWISLPLCVYFMIIIMNEEKQFSMFAQKDEGEGGG